jgi:4-hydroxyphenylacetate 3-monooxygenase
MILTGKEYLESIQDGRALYVGGERIDNQVTHPAFAGGARTYAAWFDLKADPALRDLMTYEEDGERYSAHWLRPRQQEDLRRRSRAHRRLSEFHFGLMGRTPDAVAGNITGLAMNPAAFEGQPGGSASALLSNWDRMRRQDVFATYAIVPPQSARNRDYYGSKGLMQPALRVTAEDDAGVTLNGLKMLATGAAYAHEVLIGNVMPLGPDQRKEAITCIIPLNLQGLSLWSRPPLNRAGMNPFDSPLTTHFDESDCMLVFKDVKVPWERVLVHDNPALSREIYIQTPAHVLANHQSTVRFGTKLRFLLAIASLVTRTTGARAIPAVQETLGRLAALEAGFNGLVDGQVEGYQPAGDDYVLFNRRSLYAGLNWALEVHSPTIDTIRELMGGAHFQFPASISVLDDPELGTTFTELWSAGETGAVERMKLFKLAWDLIGSEHASRAASYEKLFVGPAFAVRNYNFLYTPWDDLHSTVEQWMAGYGPARE